MPFVSFCFPRRPVVPCLAASAASRAFSAIKAAAEVSSCTAVCVRTGSESPTSPACITITPQSDSLTKSTMRGSVKPVTSFTIEAPTRTAALATSTWRVSIETMAPAWARARTTGSTRLASSSGVTGVKPGRVDSPPTSMMSAPSSSICRPCLMATSGSTLSPPSLNESGVTLSTPMMRGRSNFNSYFPQRQTLESRAIGRLLVLFDGSNNPCAGGTLGTGRSQQYTHCIERIAARVANACFYANRPGADTV